MPPGTRSDALLVTNLANYVQPVIRYQLGDSVVISDHRCVWISAGDHLGGGTHRRDPAVSAWRGW